MFTRYWSRRLISFGLIGLSTTIIIEKIRFRSKDLIEKSDEFSIYTNEQQKKYFFSGMHQPFLTNDIEQMNFFQKHFPQYQFLIGKDLQEIQNKHSLKTPVKIQSIKYYQNQKINFHVQTLCVGGPPALIAASKVSQDEKNLIYLNDWRRIPIANGSAWHLEQDAHTEAPTNYKPTKFVRDQLKRILFENVSLKDICETGEFPWRTIDWIEWIRHPEHWFRALKLSFQFELFTMFNNRTNLVNDVAKQCQINEVFFDQLNENLNGKLLLNESGSIIIARNEEEMNDLKELKENLIKEGRDLQMLSKDDFIQRYGFLPNGLMFAEKLHDRVLFPNFMEILKDYLIEQGANVLNGTLKTIFLNENEGGIALFTNENKDEQFIQFSRLILSLGNQEIFNENNQRLFDVVSARGVSMLALVYFPKHIQLPSVLVCGGTNHATKLSSQPISVNQQYNCFLMRFTAGACITPNLSNQFTSFYDSTIATGLLQSVQNTLGNKFLIKPIFVYGCNRQVSQHGQISWIEPYKNVFIQYGAAGGGLTRAPDLITTILKK